VSLTHEQSIARACDTPQRLVVTQVRDSSDGWFEVLCGSTCFWLEKKYGVMPRIGDVVSLYTVKCSIIRGIDLNGRALFYRTDIELENEHQKLVAQLERDRKERFEKAKDTLDAQYDALPDVFKQRIDKFRNANPDFRWEYESYEMFCCTEAVAFAEAARQAVDGHANDAEVDAFYGNVELLQKAAYGSREEAVSESDNPYVRWLVWANALNSKAYDYDYQRQLQVLRCSNGHSGNTFGAAMQLAWLYIEHPDFVEKAHGALTPLVGCKKYGCPHDEGEESNEA
jgi:hypothetical protein